MPPLRMPDAPEGPLRDLQRELHELHARAGWPSTRELAKHLGRTHTAVHELFTKASVPRLPDLLDVVGCLAELDRRASRRPGEVLDRFDALWSAANERAVVARVKTKATKRKDGYGIRGAAEQRAGAFEANRSAHGSAAHDVVSPSEPDGRAASGANGEE